MTNVVRVLLNGKKAGLPEVREAVFQHRKKVGEVEIRVTWEPGDIERLVAEACAEGVERVVASGGDGTVNEVVDALARIPARERPEVGILPLGTANDFATSCGIPSDLSQALELAHLGTSQAVDIARANERHFINVATGGFGAKVTAETPVALKNAIGGGAYTLAGIANALNFEPYKGSMRTSDMKFDGAMIVSAVCNGRQAGGGQVLAKEALIDDGMLDISVVSAFPMSALGQVIAELNNPAADNEFVKCFKAEWMEFEAQSIVPVNLDGEPYHSKKMRFSVIPEAIKLVLPETCPLVKS